MTVLSECVHYIQLSAIITGVPLIPAVTEAEYQSEYEPTTGELWDVFCEECGENWPLYNGTMLYVVIECVNSLRPSEAYMCWQPRASLVQIMACCQAIIWTSAGILLIGSLGTNFSEILNEIYLFSFKKMHLKMSSGKWRPSCLGLNVLRLIYFGTC